MADVTILGLGIRAPDHVTPEAERAILAAREVLFVDPGAGVSAWLAARASRVTPLYAESYSEAGARRSGYHHMAARVLEAALSSAPVAFAMQGHPLLGVTAGRLILKGARALGLTVRVLPGISAFDCVIGELGLDPMLTGLQAYEATDMLLRRRPLQPDVPALIWQIGVVESCLHTQRPARPERFHRLCSHLLGIYPPGHSVTAVYASPHPLVPTERWSVALADLPGEAARIHAGMTLFIPAVAERPIVETDLLATLEDPAHLARITR